jgi:hypothetical protein
MAPSPIDPPPPVVRIRITPVERVALRQAAHRHDDTPGGVEAFRREVAEVVGADRSRFWEGAQARGQFVDLVIDW